MTNLDTNHKLLAIKEAVEREEVLDEAICTLIIAVHELYQDKYLQEGD